MKNDIEHDDFCKLLNEEDFHIDSLGRIVIDNKEILSNVNGALGANGMEDLLVNGGCSNSGCHC